MPTPLGHSLAGISVFLAADDGKSQQRYLSAFGLIALANLPDIDFIPGYFLGTPRLYHWGPTHSITATLIAALVAGLLASRIGTRFAPAFALAALAYGSHILLDMSLGRYSNAPSVGLQALWPLTTERFMFPWALFLSAPRDTGSGPVGLLFSTAVIPLLLRELLVLGPVAVVMWGMGRVRRSRTHSEPERCRRVNSGRSDIA